MKAYFHPDPDRQGWGWVMTRKEHGSPLIKGPYVPVVLLESDHGITYCETSEERK